MLKLCIFGDIHYIDTIPNWPVKRKLVEYADVLTEKMINKINKEIKPDIVIFMGDFIQATNNIETDKKNILHIWNKFKQINCPYYVLLGNHELKNVNNNKEILNIIDYKQATYSIDADEYHLVFIGTDINPNDQSCSTQYISPIDWKWLKKDLENNKDKKTIVFSHFGIAEDKELLQNFWCNTPDGENLMLRNRNELKKLLKKINVLAVFCAHLHWTKTIKEDGIDYYMIGSLTENVNNDGIPDGVYFTVELNNNRISIIENHISL